MTQDEVVRTGNRELARFLGVSLRTACRYAKDMRKAGVIFQMRCGTRTVNRWFPSAVMRFMAVRQIKKDNGEEIL